MTKRRWLLILGGVVVLWAATVLALALLIPRGPFRFLDGSMEMKMARDSAQRFQRMYTWKGDVDGELRIAQAELLARGFTEEAPRFSYHRAQPGGSDIIMLIENRRAVRPIGKGKWVEDKGWLTVIVDLKGPPSLWDRIKAVFGL